MLMLTLRRGPLYPFNYGDSAKPLAGGLYLSRLQTRGQPCHDRGAFGIGHDAPVGDFQKSAAAAFAHHIA